MVLGSKVVESFAELQNQTTKKVEKVQSADLMEHDSDRCHELVHPLAEFSQVTFNISDGELTIPVEKYGEYFKSAYTKAMNIIRKYNFFLEKGLDKNTMSPKDVLKMAKDYAEECAKEKNVKIVIDNEDILSAHNAGICSPHSRFRDYHLYMVFSNLMQNATKYTKEGSTVNIKFAEQTIKGKKYLTVSVCDEGIGIPIGAQEKVLKGERAQNAIDSGIQGTGYGLRRIHNLIKEFQGSEHKPIVINSPLKLENAQYPGAEITAFLRLKD